MKWQRILSVATVFLAISGSLLASEPEQRLQVRWSELKQLIVGKKATLQLGEGARLEGRVRKVLSGSLDFKVKKSPEPADYPKGPIQIQRETISRIEVRGLKANRAKQVGATVGTFAGTLFGSLALVLTSKKFEGSIPGGAYAAMFGAATGAAALVYRALAPKGVTLITILQSPRAEESRNPQTSIRRPDQNTSSSEGEESSIGLGSPALHSTPSAFRREGAGAVPSYFEKSDLDQFRQQARRAIMRSGALHGLKSDWSF